MKRFALRSLIALIVVCFGIGISSCSTIYWKIVELNVDKAPRTQIHRLRNETVELEENLQRQIEDIMGAYFDPRGGEEEWGYYMVDFTYKTELTNLGAFLSLLSSFTFLVPNILGMPVMAHDYRIYAYLRFFDSQGNLVETFQNTKHFAALEGIYEGLLYEMPEEKAGKAYSELLLDLLAQADSDAQLINAILEAAGPVTVQNRAAARSKVRAFEKRNKGHR